ncbi:NUDIX hydrolase [Chthonobacter albigriseus]|uniref:NUDIX hydrolase n=1 Tax=Chthonobacter albigriseus TaxID=1683161 RepID=UPI0015EFC83B|nr:NUDIX hydrolase [Chthonobacter albigriseus]
MGKKKHRSKKVRQVAALPFRRDEDGQTRVLLISSRETLRPVIPKGWPMRGKSDAKSAAIEAFEEAGVRGRMSRKPIGSYRYWKRKDDHFELANVDVYALEVRKISKSWKEQGERALAWVPQAEAAALVDDPELGTLIAIVAL